MNFVGVGGVGGGGVGGGGGVCSVGIDVNVGFISFGIIVHVIIIG